MPQTKADLPSAPLLALRLIRHVLHLDATKAGDLAVTTDDETTLSEWLEFFLSRYESGQLTEEIKNNFDDAYLHEKGMKLSQDDVQILYLSMQRLVALEEAARRRDWKTMADLCPAKQPEPHLQWELITAA